MKKVFILMIMLIALPLEAFAAKEVAMPLNVSAVKESDVYNFEIKNAKLNDLIEIEAKSEGNDKKATFKKNVLEKNNKKFISLSQKELNQKLAPSSGYSFRLRFANKDKNSNFTNDLHLGKAPIFRNYSNWAYKDLLKAEGLKLFSKEVASDTRAQITREEFAEIAVKAYKIKYKRSAQGSIKHFKDTDNKYVNMAYDLGIMSGKGDGTFSPKAHMTREDYALVVSNIFNLENGKNLAINDGKNISSYARVAVNKALNANYLSLDSNKKFNPKSKMKREEVISSIVRHI